MNAYKIEVEENKLRTCAFCRLPYEPSDVRYIFYVNEERYNEICDACANSPADAARRCRENAREIYKDVFNDEGEYDYELDKMADGLEGNAIAIENFAPDVFPTREQVERVRKELQELADACGGDA